jgi:hypothetical protein
MRLKKPDAAAGGRLYRIDSKRLPLAAQTEAAIDA